VKRSPLKRKTPLRSTDGTLKRSSLKRGAGGPRASKAEVSARENFKTVVCSKKCIGLLIPGHECEGPLQAMHVVSKHTLKNRGLRRLLWDVQNGVPGCYRIHRRHDLAVEKIPRALLPAAAFEFAEEHGLMDALERHWPGTPFDEDMAA
jgi:hypothetical protein